MNSVFNGVGLSVRLIGLSGIMFLLAGCGSLRSTQSDADPRTDRPLTEIGSVNPATNQSGSTDLLHPGDAILINFSGVSEPPPRVEDRIREDGNITLPLLGSVKAAGQTRAELQETITKLYVPKYYLRLTVSVNPDIRYFYVSGEVKREGNYMYVGGMTTLKAVAAAGGFSDFAKKSKVAITRSNGKTETVDCVRAQKDSKRDPPIYPDDRIHVPRRLW